MDDKSLYALTVLAAVGLVSFLLRALPFLLFGGRTEPPALVRYIGHVLSPAAIAMLVVYCYGGEAAKPFAGVLSAAAPYVAGAVTILLQWYRRNPLLAIGAGTAVYMILVRFG